MRARSVRRWHVIRGVNRASWRGSKFSDGPSCWKLESQLRHLVPKLSATMTKKTWLCRFCAVGIAAGTSSLICAGLIARDADPWPFIATIIAVFLVCVVDELILPRPTQDDIWSRLLGPAIRGAIIGLFVGWAIVDLASGM